MCTGRGALAEEKADRVAASEAKRAEEAAEHAAASEAKRVESNEASVWRRADAKWAAQKAEQFFTTIAKRAAAEAEMSAWASHMECLVSKEEKRAAAEGERAGVVEVKHDEAKAEHEGPPAPSGSLPAEATSLRVRRGSGLPPLSLVPPVLERGFPSRLKFFEDAKELPGGHREPDGCECKTANTDAIADAQLFRPAQTGEVVGGSPRSPRSPRRARRGHAHAVLRR